ncbi:hypothetical protein OAU81_00710 [bacterium]|nr:hypothetical protein [bacterium]
MGYYIVDEAGDTPTGDELYQYIKQHYPKMDDQSIQSSLDKLSNMFDLDMTELINMLFEERDQLKPDTDSDDTPAL